jgi:hypothetical protein
MSTDRESASKVTYAAIPGNGYSATLAALGPLSAGAVDREPSYGAPVWKHGLAD